jgi:choline dehydrogenase-like flavoprotein
MKGAITSAVALPRDHTLDADVCIVGSGAGGAVLAAGLAREGLDVVVLEAGPHATRADFTMHEDETYPRLYQEGMARATTDLAISILQGRNVGGGTTVNWTSCFRTPTRILAHWQRHFGLEALTEEALRPHFEAVEARLNIREWPLEAANLNNRTLVDGARALGWDVGPMRRNVKGCANSGYCGMGCPVDGKQAMHLTYLRDAVEAGATVLAECPVSHLEVEGDRVRAVHARAHRVRTPEPAGAQVTVRARVTALCGGAINTPALLLRSGLERVGPVGRRTFLHPVAAVLGQYERAIDPWYGAPQSTHSHRFIDRGPGKVGFFLEAAPLHPMLAAVSFKRFGQDHAALMRQLRHTSALLALHVDGLVPGDDGGRVTVDAHGRPRLDYPVGAALVEALPHAHRALARVHLAAGATRALTTHSPPRVLSRPEDLPLLEEAPYGALEHGLFSAHQMGGCTMGADPSISVVDPEHRVRGMADLFVVDGSVLPTALGVNPSETIYGLAHRAVAFVAGAV